MNTENTINVPMEIIARAIYNEGLTDGIIYTFGVFAFTGVLLSVAGYIENKLTKRR